MGAALDAAEDPFGLDTAGENAALRLWGKPGREYIRLLNELTDCDFDSHFKHPRGAPGTARCWRGCRKVSCCREPEGSARTPAASSAHDDSIRFLACPGIRREVEIVADSIW